MLFHDGSQRSVLPHVINHVRQLAESSLIVITPAKCNKEQGHPEQDIKPLLQITSPKHCVVQIEDQWQDFFKQVV